MLFYSCHGLGVPKVICGACHGAIFIIPCERVLLLLLCQNSCGILVLLAILVDGFGLDKADLMLPSARPVHDSEEIGLHQLQIMHAGSQNNLVVSPPKNERII